MMNHKIQKAYDLRKAGMEIRRFSLDYESLGYEAQRLGRLIQNELSGSVYGDDCNVDHDTIKQEVVRQCIEIINSLHEMDVRSKIGDRLVVGALDELTDDEKKELFEIESEERKKSKVGERK